MAETSSISRRASRARDARTGEERELALLGTAEQLLNDGVFESAALAEIARRSGVSRPGFYFYFASKDALLSALIVRTIKMIVDQLPQPSSTDVDDPAQALAQAIHGAAQLWYEHRAVLTAATELSAREPVVFDCIVEAQEALIIPTSKLLRRGDRVHSAREARQLAEMYTWMAERNFYVLSRQRPSSAQLHALADRLLDVWVAGAGLRA